MMRSSPLEPKEPPLEEEPTDGTEGSQRSNTSSFGSKIDIKMPMVQSKRDMEDIPTPESGSGGEITTERTPLVFFKARTTDPTKQHKLSNLSSPDRGTNSMMTLLSNSGALRISQLFKVESDLVSGSLLTNQLGDTFKGKFSGGLAHGIGELRLSTGYTYQGEFSFDIRHGLCCETLPSGIQLSSTYVNGVRHGPFISTFKDGSEFRGNYLHGVEDSVGVFVDRNKVEYRGKFKSGELEGAGVVSYPNGEVFIGSFKKNRKEGEGKFIWPDGKIFYGVWRDNQCLEAGNLYDPSNGAWKRVVFKKGK